MSLGRTYLVVGYWSETSNRLHSSNKVLYVSVEWTRRLHAKGFTGLIRALELVGINFVDQKARALRPSD